MTDFSVVMGIETEYGIVRNDLKESDPVIESMELVRSYQSADLTGWLYQGEDPSLDARGFRVDNLAQDEEEKAFTRSDYKRFFSFHEMKSDRILSNGGRFYNDHTHPEFSTPESSSIMELLHYDRAGLDILRLAKKKENVSWEEMGSSPFTGTIRIIMAIAMAAMKTICCPGIFRSTGSFRYVCHSWLRARSFWEPENMDMNLPKNGESSGTRLPRGQTSLRRSSVLTRCMAVLW